MYDLVSLGELLIDFTPMGISEQGNPCFERNPGGGPANMACAAARFGAKVSLITKVGDDMFGQALKKLVEEQGVGVENVILSPDYKTTLAFVQLDSNGERSFSFYRRNGADTMLHMEEIDLSTIDHAKYFFLSSVLMAEGSSREASFELVNYAKSKGLTIVFDPNLRFNLWGSREELRACVYRTFIYSDIVKVSEEELAFLANGEEINDAARRLMAEYKLKLLLITLGADGCLVYTPENHFHVEGFRIDNPVDTTAAGDSFTGGFVSRLVKNGKHVKELTMEEITEAVRFANSVGALTITKKGAISALPTYEEVQEFLSSHTR
jgi:sugar/nucleoside kinase (ribokinase family)